MINVNPDVKTRKLLNNKHGAEELQRKYTRRLLNHTKKHKGYK